MIITILRYSHRHGHDIIPCLSEDLAYKVALKLVKEYRDEFEIDSSTSDEDAYENWYELTSQGPHQTGYKSGMDGDCV